MTDENKIVNGFCFMPPSLGAWISKTIPEDEFRGRDSLDPFKKAISRNEIRPDDIRRDQHEM